jgi:hypothetical protein
MFLSFAQKFGHSPLRIGVICVSQPALSRGLDFCLWHELGWWDILVRKGGDQMRDELMALCGSMADGRSVVAVAVVAAAWVGVWLWARKR